MIQLLIIAVFIIVAEAALEAKLGDKRHWTSLLGSVLLYAAFAYREYGLDSEIAYSLVGVYLPVRFWFDEVYNLFDGKPYGYLGTTSLTDRIWTAVVPRISLRTMIRMAFSVGLLIMVGIPFSYGVYVAILIAVASLTTIGYFIRQQIK